MYADRPICFIDSRSRRRPWTDDRGGGGLPADDLSLSRPPPPVAAGAAASRVCVHGCVCVWCYVDAWRGLVGGRWSATGGSGQPCTPNVPRVPFPRIQSIRQIVLVPHTATGPVSVGTPKNFSVFVTRPCTHRPSAVDVLLFCGFFFYMII